MIWRYVLIRIFNMENPRSEITALLSYYQSFLVNPIGALKQIPNAKFAHLLVTQALAAFLMSFIVVVFRRDFEAVFFLIALPFMVIVTTLILTAVLFTYFRLFARQELPLERLHTLTTLSTLPYVLGFPLYQLLPPLMIVTGVSCGLALITGLVENFGVSKQRALQIVGIIVGTFLVLWIINRIMLG